MKRLLIVAAMGLALAACTTLGFPAPKTPAQAVYAAKANFLAAVTIAGKYKSLPPCGGVDPICSDPNITPKIKLSAEAAKATLDAAEATVRDPNFQGGGTDAAIVAAQNAVTAFVTITTNLKVQQ